MRLRYLISEGEWGSFLLLRLSRLRPAVRTELVLRPEIMMVPMTATRTQRPRRSSHAHLPSIPGIMTFIPKNPVMNVGNMSDRDIVVRRFMMTFMLFPMTEANASIVPVRISE